MVLWDVITYPYPRYLFLAPKSSYNLALLWLQRSCLQGGYISVQHWKWPNSLTGVLVNCMASNEYLPQCDFQLSFNNWYLAMTLIGIKGWYIIYEISSFMSMDGNIPPDLSGSPTLQSRSEFSSCLAIQTLLIIGGDHGADLCVKCGQLIHGAFFFQLYV